MSWIKLIIHPEHDKILHLADLTGASPEAVFAAIVRWFRWVDEHADGPAPIVSKSGLRAITRWPDDTLCTAMQAQEVAWLVPDGERVKPTKIGVHFGGGAKRRATEAVRKMSARMGAKRPHRMRTQCAPEESREEERRTMRARAGSEGGAEKTDPALADALARIEAKKAANAAARQQQGLP